jgi:hypothetical protein
VFAQEIGIMKKERIQNPEKLENSKNNKLSRIAIFIFAGQIFPVAMGDVF